MSKIEFGTTLSQKELRHKEIDLDFALGEFKNLGLSWMRLACYWDEIEKQPGKYDFQTIEKIVSFCEENKIKIIMCLGMKSPRWPEFHLPAHKTNLVHTNLISPGDNKKLLKEVIRFNAQCVEQFGKTKAITVWHIENEAMDVSGPQNLALASSFLAEEIKALRKKDGRKILVSLWGNKLLERSHFPQAITLGDIVGLDVYPRVPQKLILGFVHYQTPNTSGLEYVARLVRHSGKELWITELQAEPWETSEEVKNSNNPPSFLPKHFQDNLNYALSLSPNTILFWGSNIGFGKNFTATIVI
ncbi:MAG: beta-galactosidase [bacterium]|nr:beta-galactosidase [bacterium]